MHDSCIPIRISLRVLQIISCPEARSFSTRIARCCFSVITTQSVKTGTCPLWRSFPHFIQCMYALNLYNTFLRKNPIKVGEYHDSHQLLQPQFLSGMHTGLLRRSINTCSGTGCVCNSWVSGISGHVLYYLFLFVILDSFGSYAFGDASHYVKSLVYL